MPATQAGEATPSYEWLCAGVNDLREAAANLRLRLRLHRAGFRARPVAAGACRRHRRGARARGLDGGLAVGPLAHQQILDLVAGERLELEQAFRQGLQIGALLGEDLLRLLIAFLDI